MLTSLKLRNYLILGSFLAISSFQSCKKDNVSSEGTIVERNTGPQLVDSFRFMPNKKIKSAIKIKDSKGNIYSLEDFKDRIRKGMIPLTCGTSGALDYVDLQYSGFFFDNICFTPPSGTPSSTPWGMGLSFDITLPYDVQPIIPDANSKTSVNLTPYGWISSPSGTGDRDLAFGSMTLIGSFTISGYSMKTWRIVNSPTSINMNDFCLNASVNSVFQLATNCPDLTIVSSTDITGTPFQEGFDLSTKKQIPGTVLAGSAPSGNHQFSVTWQIPICTVPPCKTEYYFSSDIRYSYKKSGLGSYSAPQTRSDFSSFYITSLPSSGTYLFRYQVDLTGSGDWSDYVTATVSVP